MEKCEDCNYFYTKSITKRKEVYCGLRENMVNVSYKKVVNACGVNSTSTILDKNRPVCREFGNG